MKTLEEALAKIEETQKEVDAVKAKNSELIGELRKAKNKDVDSDSLRREVENLESQVEKYKEENARLSKATKELERAAKEASERADAERKHSDGLLKSSALSAELTKAGVDSAYMKALSAQFGIEAVVEVEGDARTVKIGGKPIGDVIGEWAKSDEAAKFRPASGNGGGGAGGGGGGATGKKNLTLQQFEALPHSEKATFKRDGGTIVG